MEPIPQKQRKKKQASFSHLYKPLKDEVEFVSLPSEMDFF